MARPLNEVLKKLSKPFDPAYSKRNNQGQIYFPTDIYRKYFYSRCQSFDTHIKASMSTDGFFWLCSLQMTIHGSDHSIVRSATGSYMIPRDKDTGEAQPHKVFGDPASNAESQAFKKICKSLGMGRAAKEQEGRQDSTEAPSKQPRANQTQKEQPVKKHPIQQQVGDGQEGEPPVTWTDKLIALDKYLMDAEAAGTLENALKQARGNISRYPQQQYNRAMAMIDEYAKKVPEPAGEYPPDDLPF